MVKKLFKKFKSLIFRLIRKYGPKYLRHYIWPRRLHSKMHDWNIYYKDIKKVRVNFGAGPYFDKAGWISIDYLDPKEINVSQVNKNYLKIDLSKSQDFNIGNIDLGYASHFCEHLSLKTLREFLKNVYRNTNKGGIIRIVVPDADLVMNRLQDDNLEYFNIYMPVIKNMHGLDFNSVNIANVILNQFSLAHNKGILISKKDIMDYDKNNPKILEKINTETYLDENIFESEVGRLHMIGLNYTILERELINAGFQKVIKSAFMQSISPEMREVPLFDGTHPYLSLYVEAVKTD